MKTYLISFFEQFKCLGSSCPSTCCKAWDMPVDPDTLEKYRTSEGKNGLYLRLSIRKNEDKNPVFRTCMGRCIHLNGNNLCKLQLQNTENTEEYLPLTCRLYPRHTVAYGDYRECTLDLSCIEAARIFLQNSGRHPIHNRNDMTEEGTNTLPMPSFTYLPAPEDFTVETFWTLENTVPSFRDALLSIRENIMQYLWEESNVSLWDRQQQIFQYIYACHSYLVRDKVAELTTLSLPLSINPDSSFTFLGDEKTSATNLQFPRFIYGGSPEKSYPFFPLRLLNELIFQEISDAYLIMYHPQMYRLLRAYKKHFGNLTEKECDQVFLERWNLLLKNHPEMDLQLKSYLSYLLLQTFLQSSDDYYILQPVLLSFLHMEFYMLLLLTASLSGEEPDLDKQASLLSETERLVRHNTVFAEKCMDKIRRMLF